MKCESPHVINASLLVWFKCCDNLCPDQDKTIFSHISSVPKEKKRLMTAKFILYQSEKVKFAMFSDKIILITT